MFCLQFTGIIKIKTCYINKRKIFNKRFMISSFDKINFYAYH